MLQTLLAILSPEDLWIGMAIVGGLMVFICLKTLSEELDHAKRWHDLRVEAQTLRDRQTRRLKELGIKRRH